MELPDCTEPTSGLFIIGKKGVLAALGAIMEGYYEDLAEHVAASQIDDLVSGVSSPARGRPSINK